MSHRIPLSRPQAVTASGSVYGYGNGSLDWVTWLLQALVYWCGCFTFGLWGLVLFGAISLEEASDKLLERAVLAV